jgi:hypothetical protein
VISAKKNVLTIVEFINPGKVQIGASLHCQKAIAMRIKAGHDAVAAGVGILVGLNNDWHLRMDAAFLSGCCMGQRAKGYGGE